jgi:hypothetical protein
MGGAIAKALLKTGKHIVTAVTRSNSSPSLPVGVNTVYVNYDDESSLVDGLKGQDFLVITLAVSAPGDMHSKLVHAAQKAGIRWVMPNVYGTDASNEQLASDIMVGVQERAYIAEIQSLGMKSIVMSCGFWYEWGLGLGENLFGFGLANRRLTLFDDGTVKVNASTWPQCGRAAAALLSLELLPEDADDNSLTLSQYFDGIVYISSFLVSQLDMFESVMRVTGTTEKDWTVTREDSQERYKKGREDFAKGDQSGFDRLLYTRHFWPNGGGDYTHKGLQNGALRLPKEDLDECTKETIRMVENNKLVWKF